MQQILWFLHVILLVSGRVGKEEVVCSNFGLNWSAEIRCLRAQLSQCKRAVNDRGIRTVNPYPGYSDNFIELPTRRPSLSKISSSNLTLPGTDQPGLAKILANITKQLDEKLNGIRERLEDEYKRKLASLQSRFEKDLKDAEIRADRRSSFIQNKHEKDFRILTKRLDLFSTRIYRRGQFEYAYMENRNSWYEAEEDCLAWGGHLTSISDMKENEFVRGLLRAESAWIGVNDVQRENLFVNTDRSPVVFKNFKKGQPDNAGHNENCVEMLSTGQWTDAFCLVTKPFVCKR